MTLQLFTAKFLLPVPRTSCSAAQEVFVPVGGMLLLSEDIAMILFCCFTFLFENDSIELYKLRLLHNHFGCLMPLDQQANKDATVLAGIIDPDY